MITIEFDFEEMDVDAVGQLNALLATLRLESLEVEDVRSYVAVTRDGEGKVLEKRYDLESGSLVCQLTDGDEGYQYQLSTALENCDIDEDTYLTQWRAAHPNRVIRMVQVRHFNNDNAYLIAYRQKIK